MKIRRGAFDECKNITVQDVLCARVDFIIIVVVRLQCCVAVMLMENGSFR